MASNPSENPLSSSDRGLFHVLSADQFDRETLQYIYLLTNTIRRFDKSKEGLNYLKGLLAHKRAMLYFTQPSTRTFLSFQSACHILGIPCSEIRDPSTSSELKGETAADSMRTFSSYVDLIIMRSPLPGFCDEMAQMLDQTGRPVPIINGGSGPDEHPTQAVLDIYTLMRSFKDSGGIDGKKIVMVGDLKRGRTARSLSRLLSQFSDVQLVFVSPEEFRMKEDIKKHLQSKGTSFQESDDFESSIRDADAIYMTRIQDEYDSEDGQKSQENTRFHFLEKHLKMIKPDCSILHPLPRRKELAIEVDSDPRAKYWRQERNGMWTRVALITMIFGVDKQIVLPPL